MGFESKKPEHAGQEHGERRTNMMPWEQKSIDQHLNRQDDSDCFFCKLFADNVPKNVCTLRKRELNGRGEFTCIGCNMSMS
jgi:hypothetical protein